MAALNYKGPEEAKLRGSSSLAGMNVVSASEEEPRIAA